MKNFKFNKKFHFLFWMFFCGTAMMLSAQTDPSPFTCGTGSSSNSDFGGGQSCPHTSQYWSNNAKYLPDPSYTPLKIRVNLVILQRADGSGNFQDNATDRAFLNSIIDVTNQTFANLVNRNEEYFPGQNLPFLQSAAVQFVPNIIFIKNETWWNNRNDVIPGVPYLSNWYLNPLDNTIYNNPDDPKAINLYFTSDGQLHQEMVVLGTTTDYDHRVYFKQHAASEIPSVDGCGGYDNFGDFHSMRCHIANVWLKLWWFRNVLGYPDWLMQSEAGKSIAHELGHLMGLCHTPSNHVHSLMRTEFGGFRDYMTTREISNVHRAFGIYPSLWQFVDCDATYVTPSADRVVNTNETWDLKMRLYSNVVVRTGATLTITCEILMPYNGTITVERGAKLIINGGVVKRANTCSPTQFWQGVIAKGNNALLQPSPTGSLGSDQGSVVLLKGDGMIEGAVIGVATKGHPVWDEPQFRGALVQGTDFTFRDCRKGVEFMKYDLPNFSKFDHVLFERTGSGSMHTGVSIWDTDGILFERCTFNNIVNNGIVGWDAVFNVKQKNRFNGSQIAILAGASTPLNGQIEVGVLGLVGDNRNKFVSNTVGIRATANTKINVLSNDFSDFDFDVAINGTTQSTQVDNSFSGQAAGNQFESTGNNKNETLCNRYMGNIVGTNIIGKNSGYFFRQEDFMTDQHDLFIEGTQAEPGEVEMLQGTIGAARWNYFTIGKPENIKTSTVVPNNFTTPFFYFHPDETINARLKPNCAQNDANCTLHSKFMNIKTTGAEFSNCMFPPQYQEPCRTKPCLDAIRLQIAQLSAQYSTNPNTQLAGEIDNLVTQREYITSELVRDYIAANNWTAVETLLNEDMNPYNRRRMVAVKLERNQYSTAMALLQSFPQVTLHDQYFVQVQTINAARLSNSSFSLNNSQEALLITIANSQSPEAGYAQTLLGILKGRVFMPRVPDLGTERSDEPAAGLAIKTGDLQVSPNPVSDVLNVNIAANVALSENPTIELREMTTGRLVQTIRVQDGNNLSIPVQTLSAGMYVLTLRNNGAIVAHQKVVVQH